MQIAEIRKHCFRGQIVIDKLDHLSAGIWPWNLIYQMYHTPSLLRVIWKKVLQFEQCQAQNAVTFWCFKSWKIFFQNLKIFHNIYFYRRYRDDGFLNISWEWYAFLTASNISLIGMFVNILVMSKLTNQQFACGLNDSIFIDEICCFFYICALILYNWYKEMIYIMPPTDDLIYLLRSVLENNVFEFDGKLFIQKIGVAIGAMPSPECCDILMFQIMRHFFKI
jgi:hypothetical protein